MGETESAGGKVYIVTKDGSSLNKIRRKVIKMYMFEWFCFPVILDQTVPTEGD